MKAIGHADMDPVSGSHLVLILDLRRTTGVCSLSLAQQLLGRMSGGSHTLGRTEHPFIEELI